MTITSLHIPTCSPFPLTPDGTMLTDSMLRIAPVDALPEARRRSSVENSLHVASSAAV
jgi:hypothetical protein